MNSFRTGKPFFYYRAMCCSIVFCNVEFDDETFLIVQGSSFLFQALEEKVKIDRGAACPIWDLEWSPSRLVTSKVVYLKVTIIYCLYW